VTHDINPTLCTLGLSTKITHRRPRRTRALGVDATHRGSVHARRPRSSIRLSIRDARARPNRRHRAVRVPSREQRGLDDDRNDGGVVHAHGRRRCCARAGTAHRTDDAENHHRETVYRPPTRRDRDDDRRNDDARTFEDDCEGEPQKRRIQVQVLRRRRRRGRRVGGWDLG
jgi:hypothetical protein